MSENPNDAGRLTEAEQHTARMAALAWSGGRASEDALYAPIAAMIAARVAAVRPKYVCATCRTAWTGDVRECPTCPAEQAVAVSS